MLITYTTKSSEETQKIGNELGKKVLEKGLMQQAVIVCLQGDLGAGKTTFTQGFAKGLGIQEKVLSPTFVVMKRFEIPDSLFKNFYHLDCYRMENEKDAETLDLQEVMNNPENIVLIEWPERIITILPEDSITINFKHLEENKRELTSNF